MIADAPGKSQKLFKTLEQTVPNQRPRHLIKPSMSAWDNWWSGEVKRWKCQQKKLYRPCWKLALYADKVAMVRAAFNEA